MADEAKREKLRERIVRWFGGYTREEFNRRSKELLTHQEERIVKRFNAEIAGMTLDVSAYQQWQPKDRVNARALLEAVMYDCWLSAAHQKIISAIMQLPWRLTVEVPNDDGESVRRDIEDTDMKDSCASINLFNDPHPKEDWTWIDWIDAVFTYWEATGESYVLKYKIDDQDLEDEKPVEKFGLQPLRPDKVTPRATEKDGLIGYDYEPDDDSRRATRHGEAPKYQPDQVVHFAYFNPLANYTGKAPALAAWDSLCTNRALRRVNRSRVENHFEAGGTVEFDKDARITDEQLETVQAQLQYKATPNRAGEIRVLPVGAKLNRHVALSDMQYQSLQRAIVAEVSAATGVHSALMGLTESYNRANILGILKIFFETVIMPKCAKFAAKVNRNVLPDVDPELVRTHKLKFGFDFSGIEALKADPEKSAAATKNAVGTAWMTPNEAREQQGMPTLDDPEADRLFVSGPSGMMFSAQVPVAAAGAPVVVSGDELDKEPVVEWFEPLDRIDWKRAEANPSGFTRWRKQRKKLTVIESGVIARIHARGKQEMESVIEGLDEYWSDWKREGVVKRAGGVYVVRKAPVIPKAEFDAMIQELGRRMADEGEWLVDAIAPGVEDAMIAAGKLGAGQLEVGFSFDLLNPNVDEYKRIMGERIRSEIPATTRDIFRRSMYEGYELGEGITELTERVKAILGAFTGKSDWRAELIARTETNGAFNFGSIQSYRQEQITGTKHWISAFDDRIRDWHKGVSSVRGVDTPFLIEGPSGTATMQHPGDPAGGAEQVCNCRCAIGLSPE